MLCFFCPYLGVQVNPGPAGILAGHSLSGSVGSWGCIPANAPAKLCKQTGPISWTGSLARECELAWQSYALNPFQPAVPPGALINEHPALPSGHPPGCCCSPVHPWAGQDADSRLGLFTHNTSYILLLKSFFVILI